MAISRSFRKKIIFFGVFILFLLIPYFALNEESKTLDNKTRHDLPGKQKRQIMLIWGKEDKIYPIGNSEKVRAAIPGTEFHALDGTGHIPNYEAPEKVNPLIVEFLKR